MTAACSSGVAKRPKGIRFFRYLGEDVAIEHEQIGDRAGYEEINALADTYIRRFSAAEIDRVTVIYQRFFSAGVQKPVAEALLPLARRLLGLDPVCVLYRSYRPLDRWAVNMAAAARILRQPGMGEADLARTVIVNARPA